MSSIIIFHESTVFINIIDANEGQVNPEKAFPGTRSCGILPITCYAGETAHLIEWSSQDNARAFLITSSTDAGCFIGVLPLENVKSNGKYLKAGKLLRTKLVKSHIPNICHAGLSGILPGFSDRFPTSGNDRNETLQMMPLVYLNSCTFLRSLLKEAASTAVSSC
jgi:hypothetical protein